MPACLVQHHHGMFVLSQRFGKAVKEGLHRRCIGVRHDEREGVISARLHGGEDIGEGKALIAKARRALAPLPPDVADASLLPDPGFVLEEHAKALVFVPQGTAAQFRVKKVRSNGALCPTSPAPLTKSASSEAFSLKSGIPSPWMATASISTSRSGLITPPSRSSTQPISALDARRGHRARGLGIDHDFAWENPGANHLAHSRHPLASATNS
jgi:hypothetical protein